jgi:hypothetical protein
VQLFRLPRSPLWGVAGGVVCGVRLPWCRPVVGEGLVGERAAAYEAIEVSSRRFEIHVYDPERRSWKFPVSKMKHYLTWWATSMPSRCNTLQALGMLRDRPADHEKAVREAPGAVEGVARVLGGKKDLGANITKLFDGATDRERARPQR